MKEEVEKWIKKARSDLEAAKYNLEGGILDVSAFLCHQAAEKALKAVFIFKFKKLWKTHDLFELSKKLDAGQKIIHISKELNPHYNSHPLPRFRDL